MSCFDWRWAYGQSLFRYRVIHSSDWPRRNANKCACTSIFEHGNLWIYLFLCIDGLIIANNDHFVRCYSRNQFPGTRSSKLAVYFYDGCIGHFPKCNSFKDRFQKLRTFYDDSHHYLFINFTTTETGPRC